MRHADAELQLWLANERMAEDQREVEVAQPAPPRERDADAPAACRQGADRLRRAPRGRSTADQGRSPARDQGLLTTRRPAPIAGGTTVFSPWNPPDNIETRAHHERGSLFAFPVLSSGDPNLRGPRITRLCRRGCR